MMRRRMAGILAVLMVFLAACPALAEEIYVVSVSLDVNALALRPGGNGRQLQVTVEPANATHPQVYWMSSNESVATVDGSGYVTPRGVGITVITAETGNAESDTCTVTVTDNLVTTISISEPEITMPDRTAYVLEAEVSPMTAQNTDVSWSTSDKSVAVVNQNGKVFSKGAGTCWISATANGGVDVVARCKVTVTPSSEPFKYIAVTFDDGPCDNTLDILDILDMYDVRVTFFTLGEKAEQYPNYIRKEAARGHEVANHTYEHETLTKLSLEKAKEQIDKADEVLESILGYPSKVCRAPGGSINEKVAKYIGKPFIDWTVDTNDWKYRDPEHVWTFIARNAGNYDIILMHDIRPTTMEGIKKAIPFLLEQGFTFITISELLEMVGGVDETMIYDP